MSLLRLAPWRRAPRLLLGQPLVALAVAGAAAVLSVATAATPAFTSTLGTAEVARELAPACPLAISPAVFAEEPLTGGALLLGGPASSGAAPGAGMAVAAAPLLGQRSTTVAAAARELPLVGPPQLQLVSERLTAGQDASSVVLVSVAGWRRHITPVGASDGPGLWVPVALARREGLAVGSRLPLGAGAERVAGARVAGVYAPLAMRDRVPAFWCGQRDLFVLADAFSSAPLPDVLLGDPGDLLTAVGGLDLGPASAAWVLPLEMRRLRLDRLQHLVDRLPALGDRLTRGVTGFDRDRIHLHADITFTARRAAAVQSSVAGAVRPVAVATVLVALLLVAAAGGLWVERQQREVRLLSARGVGPVALRLKALLETGPAAVVGAVAGAALALVLVRGFGPSSVLGPHAVRDAVLAGAGSTLAALLVLGGSAGTRAVLGARAVRAPAPAWVRWLPVELLLLGGAWLALRRLSAAPLQAAVGTRVPKLDVLVIIFPLLLLTGAAVLVARFTSSALGVAARGDGRRGGSDALWLALRRAAGARGVSAVLVAAAALPLGALCYAATITDSVRTTVEDKALSSAGAASVVRVRERSSLPPLAVPATVVRTAENPDTSRSDLHLLGVDPATFVSAAAWLPEDSGTSLPTLMRRLAAPASPDTLPVIAVGDDVPASLPTGVASRRLSVLVVGRAKSFPSAGRGVTTLVASLAALPGYGFDTTAVWSRAPADRLLDALTQAGVTGFATDRTLVDLGSTQVLRLSTYLPVSWTFGYLEALGVLTGVIAAGGLLLHLVTRTRSRQVSYLLSRRMGLSRGRHLGSLLGELGALLGTGAAAGVLAAVLGCALVNPHLDVAPDSAPAPLLRFPVAVYLAVLGAALLMAVVGALVAQRGADRASPAQVLRATA